MMKRTLSCLLALALSLSLLAGVALSEGEGYDFSVMIQTAAADASEFPILKLLEEGTGYKIDYIEVSPAAASEQYQLMWMSGEYADVVVGGVSESDLVAYAAEGIIIDMAPYMTPEIMPNMNKYMRDFEWDLITDSEGHRYFFPYCLDSKIGSSLAINQAWLDKLGLETPNTPDELMAVWKAFKDNDPNGNSVADEIPFSTELIWSNALETLNPMFGMFGVCGGWQVDDEGNVFFGQATDGYREGVKWFRECYEAGLLDAEIFTQDMTSFKAKAQSDPLVFGSVLSFVYTAYTRCFLTDVLDQYVSLLPMQDESGVRRWTSPSVAATNAGLNTVVTSACKDPEKVARWIDYMCEPYIGYQIDQAPVGYGFQYNEETGLWTLDNQTAPAGYATFQDWRDAMHTNKLPRILTSYSSELAHCQQDYFSNVIEVAYRARDVEYRANCALNHYLDMDSPTEDEANVDKMYSSTLDTYWKSTVASWITGNGDVDAEWDAFIKGMNDMGLEALTEAYQARYDRKQ